ncbi:MarR family winged helix-turn-helix transcriptional regulator [Ensifer soli]|uniref:MarR family winged helix-turn-helix transcriptional regulator n=1 Tax=Ciceribacter sp. sgz301302 TaxID=3342379 RepID=UPI0035BAFEF2
MTSCYCILLRKAGRRLTARYDAALKPFGITVAQFSHLRHVGRSEPVSLTVLADRLDLDRSTVGRNSKVLERMGLLNVGPGEDQREQVLTLTRDGREMLVRAAPAWDAAQAEVGERLGTEGRAKLAEILALM